ncbi:MAG TPA: DMT family transporter [Candidatus Limnocylindria bacterium]|nr:DMT family transporter [Candidatus Limnocylindria bacterium]
MLRWPALGPVTDEPITPHDGPQAAPGAHDERDRLLAAGETLLVTFLWATSWVLIKVGLQDLDLEPVSFAGLRYALAAAVLAPLGWRSIRAVRSRGDPGLDGRLLLRVALLGAFLYALAQGAQFAALEVLPAATVGLVLATIPIWVGTAAWLRGDETASRWQAAGIAVLVAGAALYFGGVDLGTAGWVGLAAAVLCAGSSTIGQHLSRDLNRDDQARLGGAIGLTALSMAIGSALLLAAGVWLEGWPELDLRGWAIVGWLAVVNTALAFSLYNRALRVLTAVESSVIVNLMLVMVAAMAWIFLGEALDPRQIVGLALATAGVLIVQVAPRWRSLRRPSRT